MKNYILSFIIVFIFMSQSVQAQQDITIHETFEVNPDMEMLISHEYYNGIKIKGIKIKQVEIKKDTYIKNGEIIEGEPNYIYVLIEITDMLGNKTEIFGGKTLSVGDYAYKLQDD